VPGAGVTVVHPGVPMDAVPPSTPIPDSGEITLLTAFQHGVRLAVPGSDRRMELPLVVTVRDNGPGIPEDIRANLFEPFVTSRASGSNGVSRSFGKSETREKARRSGVVLP
jgi:nitrogen-specific signal transduction histidine kinase